MQLKRCHVPIIKNANPSDTWPEVPPFIITLGGRWWFVIFLFFHIILIKKMVCV